MARRRTAAEHYSQAQDTEALYHHLGGQDSTWPEWSATLLFYTAVQEVEAVLRALKRRPSGDHRDRKEQIKAALPANLVPAYESLEQVSKDARYDGYKPTRSRLQLLELQLSVVRSEIQKAGAPPY